MTPTDSAKTPSLSTQAFWLLAAKTAGFVIYVTLPMILARALDKHEYGLYRQAFTLVMTGFSLLSMSIGHSAFYYFPRRQGSGRGQVALNVLLFHLVTAGPAMLLIGLAPGILLLLFGASDLVPFRWMIGLAIFLMVVSSFLETVATALADVAASSTFIVAAQLSKTLLLAGAAWLAPSLEALLWASIVQGILQTALLIVYLHRRFGAFWRTFDFAFFKEQIAYALPWGFNGILAIGQSDLHKYFVSNRFGPEQFAVYAIGCFQVPLVVLLYESVMGVLIPRVSKLQHEGDVAGIVALLGRAFRKLALGHVPLIALLMVCGQELLIVFYSSRYADAWPIFRINLWMMLTGLIVTDPVLRGWAEHRYFIVKVRIIMLALSVPVLWFTIRDYGLTGAAAAVVALAIAERAMVSWKSAVILQLRPADWKHFASIIPISAVSAIAAAAAYAVHLQLAAAKPIVVVLADSAVFGFVFIAVMTAARQWSPDEVAAVQHYWNRLRRRWLPVPGSGG